MKITKYKKLKNNEYEVIIDDEKYILYDDIIVKYNLLFKKNIKNKELDNIIKENNESKSYYLSIKYITKKLRCESEIRDYLKRKGYDEDNISKTILKLRKYNFLNDNIYISSYINDQINLTLNGPIKIKNNLNKLGFDEEKIIKYLNKLDRNNIFKRIEKIINKKIKTNHNYSNYILKQKINNYLLNLGYEKKDIDIVFESINLPKNDIINKQGSLILSKLKRKYENNDEIILNLKNKLYQKGFSKEEIDNFINNNL